MSLTCVLSQRVSRRSAIQGPNGRPRSCCPSTNEERREPDRREGHGARRIHRRMPTERKHAPRSDAQPGPRASLGGRSRPSVDPRIEWERAVWLRCNLPRLPVLVRGGSGRVRRVGSDPDRGGRGPATERRSQSLHILHADAVAFASVWARSSRVHRHPGTALSRHPSGGGRCDDRRFVEARLDRVPLAPGGRTSAARGASRPRQPRCCILSPEGSAPARGRRPRGVHASGVRVAILARVVGVQHRLPSAPCRRNAHARWCGTRIWFGIRAEPSGAS